MNCPSCHNDVEILEKNFGALFTCPRCQAVYFINFEGHPEFTELAEVPDFADQNIPSLSEAESGNLVTENNIKPDVGIDFLAASDPLVNSFEHPSASLENFPKLENQDSEFSHIAQEISDFGNSEVQISGLNYDLQIAGLDSKVELLAFKEAINDSRFGWDVAEIMKQIKNGQLSLQRLNAVQAYIVARRIHFLDLELKWKQNVLE